MAAYTYFWHITRTLWSSFKTQLDYNIGFEKQIVNLVYEFIRIDGVTSRCGCGVSIIVSRYNALTDRVVNVL